MEQESEDMEQSERYDEPDENLQALQHWTAGNENDF